MDDDDFGFFFGRGKTKKNTGDPKRNPFGFGGFGGGFDDDDFFGGGMSGGTF